MKTLYPEVRLLCLVSHLVLHSQASFDLVSSQKLNYSHEWRIVC